MQAPVEAAPTPTANKPLVLEEVQAVWNEFAERRKGQVAEYQLLKRDFQLIDNRIVIALNNPIEEPLLQNMRTSLITFLRDKLGNSALMVSGELKEVESKRQLYTNKEKFDYLLEQNPALQKLKDRFGLDAEF